MRTRQRAVPDGNNMRLVVETLREACVDVPVDLRGVPERWPDPERYRGARERAAKRIPRRLKKRLARPGASKAELVVAWFYPRSRWPKPPASTPAQYVVDRADEQADYKLSDIGVPTDAPRRRETIEKPWSGAFVRRTTVEFWE